MIVYHHRPSRLSSYCVTLHFTSERHYMTKVTPATALASVTCHPLPTTTTAAKRTCSHNTSTAGHPIAADARCIGRYRAITINNINFCLPFISTQHKSLVERLGLPSEDAHGNQNQPEPRSTSRPLNSLAIKTQNALTGQVVGISHDTTVYRTKVVSP